MFNPTAWAEFTNAYRMAYGEPITIPEREAQLLVQLQFGADWQRSFAHAVSYVRLMCVDLVSRNTAVKEMRDYAQGVLAIPTSGVQQTDYRSKMSDEFVHYYTEVLGLIPSPEKVQSYVSQYPNTAEGYVKFQQGLSAGIAFEGGAQ